MVPKDRLTKEQAEKLGSLSKEYPKTGRAYRIVAAFDGFYKCETMEEANFAFGRLCSWMRRCRLESMKDAAATLLKSQGEHTGILPLSLYQRHLLTDQLHDTGGQASSIRFVARSATL